MNFCQPREIHFLQYASVPEFFHVERLIAIRMIAHISGERDGQRATLILILLFSIQYMLFTKTSTILFTLTIQREKNEVNDFILNSC